MKVSEDTNLRDKAKTYNVPIFDNEISFEEAYDSDFEDMERRAREKQAEKNND